MFIEVEVDLVGFETFRRGTLVPNLSSVAFNLACNSCKSLNPLDLVSFLSAILTGEGCGIPDLLLFRPGEAKFREDDEGVNPTPEFCVRLIEGDNAGILDVVVDLDSPRGAIGVGESI